MAEEVEELDEETPGVEMPAVAPATAAPASNQLPPNWWIAQPKPPSIDTGRIETIRQLYNQVPIAEASKAVETATQLEGILGYDADIKAGIPTHEALSKWAPKLFYKHPAVALRAQQQPQAPFAPTQVNVGGQDLIQMSPNRFSFKPKSAEPNLKPSDKIHAYSAQLRALTTGIQAAEVTGDEARMRVLSRQRDQVLSDMGDLTKPAAKPEGIRVRDKRSGRYYRYKGKKEHIPSELYQIVGD